MANYGDVALNLQPNWDRRRLTNRKFALWIVGHDNGKADVALKQEPDKRHQFAWIDPRYHEELAMNLSNGFIYVLRSVWDVNENLWPPVGDAEDKVYNQGQYLMARPAAIWFAQQAEVQRELSGRKDEEGEAAMEIADRAQIAVERDEEQPRMARR